MHGCMDPCYFIYLNLNRRGDLNMVIETLSGSFRDVSVIMRGGGAGGFSDHGIQKNPSQPP